MNILITRPSPQGEELVHKLLSIGKQAYHLPLIYFSSGKNLSLLINKINSLSKGDFLFIVSQQAANYAHQQLIKSGVPWPDQLQYYSLGQATSSKMRLLSGILVKYPQNEATSENLLKLPEFNYLHGRRALILKGNNGRSFLKDNLQKRGALVLCCECYNRNPLLHNKKKQIHRFIMHSNIKIIVVTTGEMIQQLNQLIPKNYRFIWLQTCTLIVTSIRLKKIAQYLGWTNIVVAHSANNNVLLNIIKKINTPSSNY